MIDFKDLSNLSSEMERLRLQKEQEAQVREEEERRRVAERLAAVTKISTPLTPEGKPVFNVDDMNFSPPPPSIKNEDKHSEVIQKNGVETTKDDKSEKKANNLDSLSFKEAFKSARNDPAKPDVFEWRGASYQTKLEGEPKSGKSSNSVSPPTAKNEKQEDPKTEFTPRRSVAQQAASEKERAPKETTSSSSASPLSAVVMGIEAVGVKFASIFKSDTEPARPNKTKEEPTSAVAKSDPSEGNFAKNNNLQGNTLLPQAQRITLPPDDAASNEVATKKAKAEYANAPEAERRKIEETTRTSGDKLATPAPTGMTDNPYLTRVSYIPPPQGGGMRTVMTNDGGAYPDAQWQRNPDIKPGRLNPSGKLDYADALVQAVAQAESGGERDRNGAVSRVGARGYMQVMPKTAMDPGHGVPTIFQVAKEQGVPFFGKSQAEAERLLGNQDVNKAFGRAYLGRLMEISGGDPIKALAAYNFGQGNVNAFVKGDKPFEKLPEETKNYIAKVAAFFHEKTNGQQLFPGAGSDLDTNRKMAASQFNNSNENYAQAAPNSSRPSKDGNNPTFTEMSREMARGSRWA